MPSAEALALQPSSAATDPRYADIERKFLDFARSRAIGAEKDAAMRSGRFSATPGVDRPELFGAVDMAYAAHILNRLGDIAGDGPRTEWIELILSFQDDDGWFRSRDKQGHGTVHATAYALGALQILGAKQPALKPLTGFQAEIAQAPNENTAPFALALLDRVHFWRGSHRAGGMAAIVAAVRELGLPSETLLGIRDPQAWLDGWWRYFEERIDPRTGYWRLSNPLLHWGFDLLYRKRHDPKLASMGGAVHLYWVSEHLRKPITRSREIVATTTALLPAEGLYEHEPYCIDLDGNFMIARALPRLSGDAATRDRGLDALRRNRAAVLAWFAARDASQWNATSHKLPGAFAAVAEADRALSGGGPWKDVFETTCWL